MKTQTLLLLAGALAAGTSAARAADILPVDYPPIYAEAPELQPVEIGSGWYLRGDVSYDLSSETRLSVERRTALAADDWFASDAKIDEAFGFGGGFGYRFTDMFRGDLTARYSRADVSASFDGPGPCLFVGGTCRAAAEGETKNWELMANAYVDFGTVVGFTPYLGAGAGAVQVKYEDAGLTYCDSDFGGTGQAACTGIDVAAKRDWRFAYSLMAGVSYDLNQALKLDIGYRFLDVDGGDATERVPLDLANSPYTGLAAKDDGYQAHTIQAGLRYSLF